MLPARLKRIVPGLVALSAGIGPLAEPSGPGAVARWVERPWFRPLGAGKPSNQVVTALLQDRRGYVWIGTQGGVDRYDGHRLRPAVDPLDGSDVLATDYVTSLAETGDGSVWVGTWSGLFRYDPTTERFAQLRLGGERDEVVGVAALLADRRGRNLWVAGMDGRLLEIDAERRIRTLELDDDPRPGVGLLGQSADGALWLTDGDGRAFLRRAPDGTTLDRYPWSELFPDDHRDLPGQESTAVVDDLGALWVCAGPTLWRLDPLVGRALRVAQLPASTDSQVLSVTTLVAADGRVWIGTVAHGLLRVDVPTGRVDRFAPEPGRAGSFPAQDVFALMIDPFGVLWAGTSREVALLDLQRKPIGNVPRAGDGSEGLQDDQVLAIAQADDGAVWLGLEAGIDRIDLRTGEVRHYRSAAMAGELVAPSGVWAIAQTTDGTLWAGSASGAGLHRLDPSSPDGFVPVDDYPEEPGREEVLYLYSRSDGSLLIGTAGGLLERDAAGRYRPIQPADRPISVRAATEDRRGRLWLATEGDGALVVDPGREEPRPVVLPEDQQERVLLDVVEDLLGRIWLVSPHRLLRLTLDDDGEVADVVGFSSAEGVGRLSGIAMVLDASGRIWLTTSGGVVQLDERQDPVTGQPTLAARSFSEDEGMPEVTYYVRAALRLDRGWLAFGGGGGLVLVDPTRMSDHPVPAIPLITELRRFDRPVRAGDEVDGRVLIDRAIDQVDSLALTHRDSVLSFAISALHTATPDRNRLWYQMSGIDPDWIAVDGPTRVTYTHLPPGERWFRVRAANADGLVSERDATLRIVVSPPWWQTWWFRAAALSTSALAVVALFSWRTRAVRRRADELQLRVDERTAELARQRNYVDHILRSMAGALLVVDAHSRLQMVNRAALALTDHDSDQELLSCTLDRLFPEADELLARAATAEDEHDLVVGVRTTCVPRDGTSIPVTVSAAVLRTTSGAIDGAVLVAHDARPQIRAEEERRLLEHQLFQASKLESVGQLAAGIAHEINTPLQFVGDNIQFLVDAHAGQERVLSAFERLADACRVSDEQEELRADLRQTIDEVDFEFLREEHPVSLTQCREGVERIGEIVRAMKEFSHPGYDRKTPLDVNSALRNTLVVSRNEWKSVAELETDLDEQLPPVSGLEGPLKQVFLNIIVNAAHALGESTVTCREQGGRIRISSRLDGEEVVIRIADNGPGVPEEIRSRIFDPFFTTKEIGKGTGQGLAIARSVVVDKHGGSLTLESEETVGTEFVIRLPLSRDAEPVLM